MKPIRTAPEPPEFHLWRREHPGASWTEFRAEARAVHGEATARLTEAQRGLCAYCEVDLQVLDRQVEHVRPRATAPDHRHDLDWGNLLAACAGGSRSDLPERHLPPTRSNLHCGQRKGNNDPGDDFIDPRSLPTRGPCPWQVWDDGSMSVDAVACEALGLDATRLQYTSALLGLDVPVLCRARRHPRRSRRTVCGVDRAAR